MEAFLRLYQTIDWILEEFCVCLLWTHSPESQEGVSASEIQAM